MRERAGPIGSLDRVHISLPQAQRSRRWSPESLACSACGRPHLKADGDGLRADDRRGVAKTRQRYEVALKRALVSGGAMGSALKSNDV